MSAEVSRDVLIVTTNPVLRRHVTRALVSIGCDVETVTGDRPSNRSLASNWDMVVIDTDDPASRLVVDSLRSSRATTPLLALSRDVTSPMLVELLAEQRLLNVIARHSGVSAGQEMIDETELINTCYKVFSGDIFGIEKYLATPSAHIHRQQLANAASKDTVLSRLALFLDRLCCHRQISREIVNVADELLMNAIFNAPVDAQGKPKFQDHPRNSPIAFTENETVDFCYACDGRHLAISVSDRAGTLPDSTILSYLKPNLHGLPVPIENKPEGAGLGLSMVFNCATQLTFNIDPGQRTEVIALFYIRSTPRAFRCSGHSFNIFKSNGASL